MNHSSKKSWLEEQFEKALLDEGIEFVYNFRNGRFAYDFAIPEIKLDIEVDGGTHKLPEVIEKDKIRDEWSREQGWTVIRFSWEDVRYNLAECIKQVKQVIEDLS